MDRLLDIGDSMRYALHMVHRHIKGFNAQKFQNHERYLFKVVSTEIQTIQVAIGADHLWYPCQTITLEVHDTQLRDE